MVHRANQTIHAIPHLIRPMGVRVCGTIPEHAQKVHFTPPIPERIMNNEHLNDGFTLEHELIHAHNFLWFDQPRD